MKIRHGDSRGIFYGGWFDKFSGKFRSALDVFTGGWFENIYDLDISASYQHIEYENGNNTIIIGTIIDIIPQHIIFDFGSINLELKMSNDYQNANALPNGWFTKCSTQYDSERKLMQKMQTEVYNTFGVPCYYYRMSYDISKSDKIWGEKNDRSYDYYWKNVQTYFQLPRENKQFSKFGIEGLENFTMYMSKEHFNYITSGLCIPKLGDLIQTQYNSNIYEIVEVKSEFGMFFLNKRYTWDLIVKPFKDEFVSITDNVHSSPLSAYTNKPIDIFDITNTVDSVKDKYIYQPTKQEKGNNDPWANWG
jgi:hypothetical protein